MMVTRQTMVWLSIIKVTSITISDSSLNRSWYYCIGIDLEFLTPSEHRPSHHSHLHHIQTFIEKIQTDLHLKNPKITRMQTEERIIIVSIKVAYWNPNVSKAPAPRRAPVKEPRLEAISQRQDTCPVTLALSPSSWCLMDLFINIRDPGGQRI